MKPKPINKALYRQCKARAQKKFKRYPSLYASIWISKEYRKHGGKYANKRKPSANEGTKRWLREQWTDVKVYLHTGKHLACGSRQRKVKACRPLKRINKNTPITLPELRKLHSKQKLLQLANKKEKDMNGRVYWKSGRFVPFRGGGGAFFIVHLKPAPPRSQKKWTVVLHTRLGRKVKTVHFGARGYSDYTRHKDADRRDRYDVRHKKREDWTPSGIFTAGFWSKWLLWNKPSLRKSIDDMQRRFRIRIIQKRSAHRSLS